MFSFRSVVVTVCGNVVELQVLAFGKYECFVMQMLYVRVLCASCGSPECCVLHNLQFASCWLQGASIWKRHTPKPIA